MKRLFFLALCIGIILVPCSPANAQLDLPSFIKQYEPAMLIVRTFDKDKKQLGLGSGFFISEDGKFLTNKHVFRRAYSAEVEMPDGKKFPIKKVSMNVPEIDLALGQVTLNEPAATFLKFAKDLPEKGERIIVFGNPQGMKFSVTEGIVSAIQEFPNPDFPSFRQRGTFLQFSAPVSPGSSGGPVLNAKGEVVGVTTWMVNVKVSENLNFAITSHTANDFLARVAANSDSQPAANQLLAVSNTKPGKGNTPVVNVVVFGPKMKEMLKSASGVAQMTKEGLSGLFVAEKYKINADDDLQTQFLAYLAGRKIPADLTDSSLITQGDLEQFGATNKCNYLVFWYFDLLKRDRLENYPYAQISLEVAVDFRIVDVKAKKYVYGEVTTIAGQAIGGIFAVSSKDALKFALTPLFESIQSPLLLIE